MRAFAILITVALIVLSGCTKSPETTSPTTTSPTSPSPPPTNSTPLKLTVTAYDVGQPGSVPYGYNPETLSAGLNATVNLTLLAPALNQQDHDIVIDELGVDTRSIGSGESASVTFTASKKGSFAFYCSVGNHRQLGMEGTFTVG